MQVGIAEALRLYFGDRGEHIVQVRPGSTMTLTHQTELALHIQAPGILSMAAIDHIYECPSDTWRRRGQRNAAHGFDIEAGRLLAVAQIRDGALAQRRRHP